MGDGAAPGAGLRAMGDGVVRAMLETFFSLAALNLNARIAELLAD